MAFNKLRLAIYWQILKRKQASNSSAHHSVSLENARQIGILFKANEPANFVDVQHFAQDLKNEGKKVDILGYHDAGSTTELVNYPSFNRKDNNLFFIPKGNEISYFQNQNYDILLYAADGFCAPLFYIASLSKANMRVGPHLNGLPQRIESFDLMIKFDNEKNSEEDILSTYLKYLKMINTDGHK